MVGHKRAEGARKGQADRRPAGCKQVARKVEGVLDTADREELSLNYQ